MNSKNPVISIGLPVRNGAKSIKKVLTSISQQTEKNYELIISDNNSNDQTFTHIQPFIKKDKRIKYFKQRKTINIFENFMFVLKEANSEFFMWASHDDFRDNNFIECLIDMLKKDKKCILAFGKLKILNSSKNKTFDFETINLNLYQRFTKTAFIQCFHIYGVWKTKELKKLSFKGTTWWGDLPFMLSACCLGTFKYCCQTTFYYFEEIKSTKDRVKNQEVDGSANLFFLVITLTISTFLLVKKNGGMLPALFSATLILIKNFIQVPGFLYRKIKFF